jgi:hypothetical protein
MQNISTEQLRRAVQIKEEIDSLQAELQGIFAGGRGQRGRRPGRPPGRGRLAAAGPRRRRKLSPAARRRIAEAARARWAKAKASGRNRL